MGREYTLTPREKPPWRFAPPDFTARIKNRWPHARIGTGDVAGSPALLHVRIPADPFSRELGIALDAEGWAVWLAPANPAAAVEFALWYVTQLPGFDPPVFLIASGLDAEISLRRDTTAEELLTILAPVDVARPDPQIVGRRAAEILHSIHASSRVRRMVAAARLLPQRWATLTGLALVAQLDLATDVEPLLDEALRVLALRAAVYELTSSDAVAATLVAPPPVDDTVRVVLAEYTLCVQVAQEVGAQLVQQTTEWTPLGWQYGNYTHHCYRTAWGEPNERYWIDVAEATRRLKILNRAYADIGIRGNGSRHNIRFQNLPDPSLIAI
jgi:hypothetical protein